MTILYIAGPMTGLPEFNYPDFHEAAVTLRAHGHDVLNPARRGVKTGWNWSDYMRASLADILLADGLALLPNWQSSRGARLEVDVAYALGLRAVNVEEWLG